jgi:hypothetical protein
MTTEMRLIHALIIATLIGAACTGQTAATTAVDPNTTTSTTITLTDVDRGLPAATEETALRIQELAEAGDIEGLAALALGDPGLFTASFGQNFEDSADLAGFWETEADVAETIAALIDLPDWFETKAVDANGQEVAIYVTPRFMHEPTESNRLRLEEALGADRVEASMADGQWLGPRLGITESGHWQFYITGGD